MKMMDFIFLYYIIKTNSYIGCSIVQYSTNNTTRVNQTMVKAKLVVGTVVNETPVDVALDYATLITEKLINATIVREPPVNVTLAYATHVSETTANEKVVNATIINATLDNETPVNVALAYATLVTETLINSTLVREPPINVTLEYATLVNETTANGKVDNATIINATLNNETLVNATLVKETPINLTIVNGTLVNETNSNKTLVNATRDNSTLANATLINATEEGLKATMKRRCVIPESELKDLLKSECFVDKSLIIKDFLDMEPHFALVTAPRRFGKTVNLKMLKAFLQAENGRRTSNHPDGCSLFLNNNLNIFTWNNTFFHLHCGKYPVIYITFRKLKGTGFNDVLDAFREVLLDSCLEHVYLLDSYRLKKREKYFFKRYITLYSGKTFTHVTDPKWVEGLLHLSETLYSHFNKKAIVLIDDLDALVWRLLSWDFQGNYFQICFITKIISFIRDFLFTFLEHNRHIERALINSCLQLSTIFLNTESSIVQLLFLENHPLVRYYGLTETEVREKLIYFNILQSHEDVKNYYNGYTVQGSGDNIYNTWSVINYLQTENLDDYWISTAGLHDLSGVFLKREVRRLVSQLLKRKIITIQLRKMLRTIDLLDLREAMTSNGECTWLGAEAFLLLLCDTGYFNPRRKNVNQVSLYIPNNEISQHLHMQYVGNSTL